MLSIENPPHLSCPCSTSELKSDERASDKRALQKEHLLKPGLAGDNELSNFSIRNYVFTARTKDIGTNWPFPPQYLKLCLNYGLKNVLPPFEPPDSVRKALGDNQLVVGVDDRKEISEVGSLERDGESCRPSSDQSILRWSPCKANPSPLQEEQEKFRVCPTERNLCRLDDQAKGLGGDKDINPSSTVTSHAQNYCARASFLTNEAACSAPQEGNTLSEASSVEVEVARPPCEPTTTGKKCRLIVKLGGIVSDPIPSRAEDNNTSTISGHMASKVCPVCKTFSSTSNTTLNAHIDQCLAVDATTSTCTVDSKLSKHNSRVKPGKKRSMVDIYSTAPSCTLEELDRRNGSKWAVDLRSPEVCAEGRRHRPSCVDLEDTDEDSAVYFDSNGKKLRILSKFKDASASLVGGDSRPRKHMKDSRDKNFFTGKRKRLAPKHSKYLTLKPQAEELHSLKPDKADQIVDKQIHAASEANHGRDGNPMKEESSSQLLKARDRIRPCESGALERNRAGSPSFAARITDNGQKSSEQPAGNHASLPRNKGVKIQGDPDKTSNSLPKTTPNSCKSCHRLSAKGKKLSTLRKNMLIVGSAFPRPKLNENEKYSSFKKSRMHRSIAEIVGQAGACLPDLDEQYDRIDDYNENQSGGLNQIVETHKLHNSYNVMGPETEEIRDEASIGESIVLESGQERVVVRASGKEEIVALGNLEPGPDFCGFNRAATVVSRVQIDRFHCKDYLADKFDGCESVSEEAQINEKDTVIERLPEKAAGGPIISSRENPSSELHKLGDRSRSLPSVEERNRSICGTEAQMGPTEPSFSDQEMGYADEIGSWIIKPNTRTREEMDCTVRDENFLSEVDTIPIPGPPGSFLPSPGGSDILQESSSLTSSRVQSSQDRHVVVDRDSSGSPVSATSTISHFHMERSDLKYSELESSLGPPAVQDKLMKSFSYYRTEPIVEDDSTFPFKVSMGRTERTNLDKENPKVSVVSPSSEPQKFSAGQSCCCSRKESISWDAALTCQESQLLRQHTMSSAMLPIKGRQMSSNPNITPVLFASFRPGSCLRIDEMMAPVVEFPTGPISMKNHPDAAVNFSSHGDSDFTSPSSQAHHPRSTSNPVLRLMGKNLMVVNKEEDTSLQLRQIPPGTPNDRPNSKYLKLLGFSNGNVPNQDSISFYRTAPEGSVIFGHDPCYPSSQCFDVGYSDRFRNHSKKAHQALQLSPGAYCHNMHLGDFAASSL